MASNFSQIRWFFLLGWIITITTADFAGVCKDFCKKYVPGGGGITCGDEKINDFDNTFCHSHCNADCPEMCTDGHYSCPDSTKGSIFGKNTIIYIIAGSFAGMILCIGCFSGGVYVHRRRRFGFAHGHEIGHAHAGF